MQMNREGQPTDGGGIVNRYPVQQQPHESRVSWGKRRKAQTRAWYAEGVSIEDIAALHEVKVAYVRDAVGLKGPGYRWEPPADVLTGPFPSADEARAESPLISSDPRRLTLEQSIQRAVQMYRWTMAGLTLQEIGDKFGISRERVRVILDKYGFPKSWKPSWKSGKPRDLPPIRDPLRRDFWRREE